MYKRCNGNLLYHGCIPMKEDGTFEELKLKGIIYSGKRLLDYIEDAVKMAYFLPDDDPTKQPEMKWSAHGQWIYSNWMNYFVYQTTPYELKNGVFVPVE